MPFIRGLIYRYPWLYIFLNQLFYGRRQRFKYRQVASHILPGESVLELCAGDGQLQGYLKGDKYVGLEYNRAFVRYAASKGRNIIVADVAKDDLPASDVVVMISSFYHFIDDPQAVFNKMLGRARKRVIICENYKTFSFSPNPFIAFLAKTVSTTQSGTGARRWAQKEWMDFCKKNNCTTFYEKEGYVFSVWQK